MTKTYSAKKPKVKITEPFWTRLSDDVKIPMTTEDIKRLEKHQELWKKFERVLEK